MGKPKHQKRSHVSVEGFRPAANPDLARAMRELGRSNSAQPHIAAPRKGTRRERERQAIRDQNRGA